MSVGLGIVTYNRPQFFRRAMDAILIHAWKSEAVDHIYVHDDGSDVEHLTEYAYLWDWLSQGGVEITFSSGPNRGVGHAKNVVMKQMIEAGHEWLFVSEDDIVMLDPDAIFGYIGACETSGFQHLMFHGHGPHNPTALRSNGVTTEWPNYVGAWCVYRRQCILQCGYHDEAFVNAWEHVEHSLRLAQRGFTAPWRGALDATGSERWLQEQPGALEHSAIRRTPEWDRNFHEGKEYWHRAHPETYAQVFGPSAPLPYRGGGG